MKTSRNIDIETAKGNLAATEHLITCLENGEECSIQVGEEKLVLHITEAIELLQFLRSRFVTDIRYYTILQEHEKRWIKY